MDRARQKKIRNIRVIATNIFMSVSVVAIVFVLMLIAMGFSFNENGGFEQSGLLQLASHPSGASVEIDGNSQFGHTEFSKMLSSSEHKVRVTKDGYDSWTSNVKIDAGLLTRVEWVRLFPNNPEINDASSYKELRLAEFSADRKWLITIEKDSNELIRANIQGDRLKNYRLSLSTVLGTDAEKALLGEFAIHDWNENCSKALLSWKNEDATTWYLVDLEHAENSVNLTKKFNHNFSAVLIANDSASKLWGLADGELYRADISESKISEPIASKVELFTNNKDVVAFVNLEEIVQKDDQPAKTERHVNTYKDGEESFTTIASLSDKQKVSGITMNTYWNEEWLAYSYDKEIRVLAGKYPSYGKQNSTLKVILERNLNFAPTMISRGGKGNIIVFAGGKNMVSYDIETKRYYDTELNTNLAKINWLDEYLLWQNVDNSTIVRDFDGGNRRSITEKTNDKLPVVVSENNRWLYYFEIPTEAIEETETGTIPYITINLKREKLQ